MVPDRLVDRLPSRTHCCEAVLRRGDGGVPRRRRDAPCSRRVLRPHGRPSRPMAERSAATGWSARSTAGSGTAKVRTSASRTRIDPTGRCASVRGRSWNRTTSSTSGTTATGPGRRGRRPMSSKRTAPTSRAPTTTLRIPDGQIRFGAARARPVRRAGQRGRPVTLQDRARDEGDSRRREQRA